MASEKPRSRRKAEAEPQPEAGTPLGYVEEPQAVDTSAFRVQASDMELDDVDIDIAPAMTFTIVQGANKLYTCYEGWLSGGHPFDNARKGVGSSALEAFRDLLMEIRPKTP